MVGQHPDMSGKAITMTVMVETYAVLALLASFLMVNAIKL
jgi:V/A-type H+-transporting ATPase subunit K